MIGNWFLASGCPMGAISWKKLITACLSLLPIITILGVMLQCTILAKLDNSAVYRRVNLAVIGDVANSKRPLLIVLKVQLRLRVTRRSATALARYPQKLAKIVAGKNFVKILVTAQTQLRSTVNNRGRLETATSAIVPLYDPKVKVPTGIVHYGRKVYITVREIVTDVHG